MRPGDVIISPICLEKRNFWLGHDSERSNFHLPEKLSKAKFDFSSKNYYPRKNTFEVEVKLNMENYFSNNHFPSKLNFEGSEISKSYLRTEAVCDSLGHKSSYQVSYQKSNYNQGSLFDLKQNEQSSKFVSAGAFHSKDQGISNDIPIRQLPIVHQPRKYSCAEDLKDKKNMFVERQGDWICVRCKNLNFSFRVVCNRCKISKNDSQTYYEDHMRNLMNIVQYNEMLQNQVSNSNSSFLPMNYLVNTANNANNNSHVFNSSLFSSNTKFNEKCKTAVALTRESLYMDK